MSAGHETTRASRASGERGSQLTARSRKRIALVTDTLFGVYQSELRKAFERAAHREGYDLVIVIGRGLGHADPGERAQNAIYEWLTPEAVDGAVLLSGVLMNFAGQSPLEAMLDRLGPLPKVSIGVELPRVPSVTVDNRAGMRAAVDHMIQQHGCQRIGYLAGPSDNAEAQARLEGYRYALEAHFLPFDPRMVEHGPFTPEGGTTAMQTLLERARVFDAIVAANDDIAVGASEVLFSRGLAVPGRVRLIAFDDSPIAVSQQFSSVAQPFTQLALHALDALKRVMQGKKVRDIAFCPRLALRGSCGCGDAESHSELPPFRAGQRAKDYIETHRSVLAENLQELNAACFDWWSTRVERLLDGLEAAVAGRDRDFLITLDALVVEAFDDGVPVEQIGRCVTRLQRQFEGAADPVRLDRLWTRALARLTATLGKAERKRQRESVERSETLRDTVIAMLGAEDEHALARRLASRLPRLKVHSAFWGNLTGAGRDRVQPRLLLEPSSQPRFEGPSYSLRQLLPRGFPRSDEPSTLLVSAINFGVHLTGIWACDGGADMFVFEQLRTELGAVGEMMALRANLIPEPTTVPRPQRLEDGTSAPLAAAGPVLEDAAELAHESAS